MTTDVQLTITGDVRRLVLEPSDRLLFTTPSNLTSEELSIVSGELQRLFPGHEAVIITGGGKLEVMA